MSPAALQPVGSGVIRRRGLGVVTMELSRSAVSDHFMVGYRLDAANAESD